MSDTRQKTGKRVPSFSPELGARIQEVIDAIGSQKKAAEIVGVRPETVGAWQRGAQKIPLLDMLELCAAAGRTINWLATGEGANDSSPDPIHIPMRTQSEHSEYPVLQIVDREELEKDGMIMLPRLDIQASAGPGLVSQSEQPVGFVAFGEAYLRDLGINPRSAHIIQVSGRSMYPTLDDKEFVVLDTSIDRVKDEAIYAVVYGGLVLIKRVRIGLDGTVTLSSDNREGGYTDQVVKPSEVHDLHIVGRLKGHFRVL